MNREHYEKPLLEELALETNNTICACTVVSVTATDSGCSLSPELSALIGIFGDSAFGNGENCESPIEGYCYFTSTDMSFAS